MNLQLDKLRPHQIEPAKWLTGLVPKFNYVVDWSDMGIGKTFTACAVANTLQKATLVVCPKIVMTAWARAAEHFGDKFSIINYEKLRTGRTPFGWWDNNPPPGMERDRYYVCQCCQRKVDFDNYEPCYCHNAGIHCLTEKVKQWRYGKFNWHPAVELIIFDEVHRCNGLDSLNGDMLIAAKQKKVLGLSATNGFSPMNFKAQGYLLDLHGLDQDNVLTRKPAFRTWAGQHGCRYFPGAGFKWTVGAERQNEIMRGIRNEVIPARGVRVSVDDIPGFPEVDISSELYDLNESPEILNRLYADMAEALLELAERKSTDKAPEHPMTRILRARQEIELLKVPIAIELATDLRAKGFSVAFFVNFQQTLDEIKRRRNIRAFIDGTPKGVKERQHWMDEFQANREREIVANAAAGGIGVNLHDLLGDFPRVGLVFPGFDAVILQQLLGRLRRDGGKSKSWYKILLAAHTVEAQVHRNLKGKLNNLSALNNADLLPDNLRLTNASLLGTLR